VEKENEGAKETATTGYTGTDEERGGKNRNGSPAEAASIWIHQKPKWTHDEETKGRRNKEERL
jgi:hypothetical protein